MSTYIPQTDAQAVVDQINQFNPPITWTEPALLAYATTPYSENIGPNGERDYYAVWKDCGFAQNCKNVADRVAGYGAASAEAGMRQEFADYTAGHNPAAPLPEGVQWTFVKDAPSTATQPAPDPETTPF